MSRDQVEQVLGQLDQALYNHLQWHNNLIRIFTCRLPADKHDIIPESYKECRFGQWYYCKSTDTIKDHPGFIAIGAAHQHMHQLASKILISLESNNTVHPQDYDNFSNALERLRLEIYALKNELEILQYNRDPLTLAINRITMLPILREVHDIVKRQGHPSCIAMMDIDLFKKVNDQHGHVVGDKVLVAISHFIISHLRTYDKYFRYGGEEFLICLQDVNMEQAYPMIDRLREEISKLPINAELNNPLFATVSFGVTSLDENNTVEEAIERADKALYVAKSTGRNRTQIWEPDLVKNNNHIVNK